MKLCAITKATDGQHKYKAEFCSCPGGETKCKTVQRKVTLFGAEEYKDYIVYSKTETKEIADAHKKSYLARHGAIEDFTDPTAASTLSRYILWNLPTFEESLSDFKKHFKI